jgi:hypothetical protein
MSTAALIILALYALWCACHHRPIRALARLVVIAGLVWVALQ